MLLSQKPGRRSDRAGRACIHHADAAAAAVAAAAAAVAAAAAASSSAPSSIGQRGDGLCHAPDGSPEGTGYRESVLSPEGTGYRESAWSPEGTGYRDAVWSPEATRASATHGYCAETETGAEGDCVAGDKGSWRMGTKTMAITDMNACVRHCVRHCARCNYVSVSQADGDCSWYHACDMRALYPAPQTGHQSFAIIATTPTGILKGVK